MNPGCLGSEISTSSLLYTMGSQNLSCKDQSVNTVGLSGRRVSVKTIRLLGCSEKAARHIAEENGCGYTNGTLLTDRKLGVHTISIRHKILSFFGHLYQAFKKRENHFQLAGRTIDQGWWARFGTLAGLGP